MELNEIQTEWILFSLLLTWFCDFKTHFWYDDLVCMFVIFYTGIYWYVFSSFGKSPFHDIRPTGLSKIISCSIVIICVLFLSFFIDTLYFVIATITALLMPYFFNLSHLLFIRYFLSDYFFLSYTFITMGIVTLVTHDLFWGFIFVSKYFFDVIYAFLNLWPF